MIATFGDSATRELFHGIRNRRARRLPPEILASAGRKLDMLHGARQLTDLNGFPGTRLEALKHDRVGWWSIRINSQWRIVFRWNDGFAYDVTIADYHS